MITRNDAETLYNWKIMQKKIFLHYYIKQLKTIKIWPVQLVATFKVLRYFWKLDFFVIFSRYLIAEPAQNSIFVINDLRLITNSIKNVKLHLLKQWLTQCCDLLPSAVHYTFFKYWIFVILNITSILNVLNKQTSKYVYLRND